MSLAEKVMGAVMAPKREAIALAQQQVAALNAAIETATSELSALEAKSAELSALEAALTVQLQGLNLAATVVQATVEAQLLTTLGVVSETNAPSLARPARESKDALVERVLAAVTPSGVTVKQIATETGKAPAQIAGALDILHERKLVEESPIPGTRAKLWKRA